MENYTVPSRYGKQIQIETEIRDSLSTLDVVWATKFEGENISPEEAKKAEAEFYKGAPPKWLNFYWAEQEGSPFVRRDMYEGLRKKIDENTQKSCSLTHTDLFHHPGSGGSTLAMQILWDLRKKLRCARVIDSATNIKAVAKQVIDLFKVGGPENQNTVLLLLDNKCTSDEITFKNDLEENLIDIIKRRPLLQSKKITATVPVVIILNCIRQSTDTKVMLRASLSEVETSKFNEKHANLIQRHGGTHTQFHAFNIMLGNYEDSDVRKICEVLHPIKKKRRPRKAQLMAYLALVNSYAPGSYFTVDLCRQFLNKEVSSLENFSLEKEMQPFTNMLVIFSTKEGENSSEDKHVRMAHPMIADEFLQLLTSDGVARSDITMKLLTDLCRDKVPQYLERTIHRILTKRGKKNKSDRQDKDKPASKAKFSRLIQDIKERERAIMCTSVLKIASKKFPKDPVFPQALARFYYIEMTDYARAEQWAKTAIKRDKDNSFISDTLGQVHKNHLKNPKTSTKNLPQVLQIGQQAMKAFEDEAEVALKEQSPDTKDPDARSTSTSFNNRGFYGYMEVAEIIFALLSKRNLEWSKVLTKEMSPHSLAIGENCRKYSFLLTRLRNEVETKFEFFEQYLTYSKPSTYEDEPSYFWPKVEGVYTNYVTQSAQGNKTVLQQLKEKKVSTFVGLLRNALNLELDLELITVQLRKLCLNAQRDDDMVQKYILANIFLSQRNARSKVLKPLGELRSILMKLWNTQKDKRTPEFYLLVLMLFWPDEEQFEDNSPDISECVKYMHQSFERTYQNDLRSRYLVPLFLLGGGTGVQKLVSISQLQKNHTDLINKGAEMAEIPNLRRVQGVVRCYKVFAVNKSKEIEVSAQCPASICREGKVSFYLGFNIKGPVAYNIRKEKNEGFQIKD